jgi:hypothetical protein
MKKGRIDPRSPQNLNAVADSRSGLLNCIGYGRATWLFFGRAELNLI